MNQPLPQLTAVNEAFIQRVVAEVLRRVKQANSSQSGSNNAIASSVCPNTLFIDSPVISLSDIDGRLTAVKELAVPPKAIVTPAVRDELRWQKVALVRRAGSAETVAGAESIQPIIVVSANIEYSPQSLVDSGVTPLRFGGSFDCLVKAIDQLETLVEPNGKALVLTDDPQAAACLANRKAKWWAAACRTANEVEQARKSIGVNLAAVDPAETNPWQLKQIAKALSAACQSKAKYRPRTKGAN
ncbi:MAG: hypothetical protein NXI22_26495 [bacterium]|nr:hypothetical protein [bacterium]